MRVAGLESMPPGRQRYRAANANNRIFCGVPSGRMLKKVYRRLYAAFSLLRMPDLWRYQIAAAPSYKGFSATGW